MMTYNHTSHPLDIAAGIRGALDTDDLRAMLADVLPTTVLDAITGWIDGLEDEHEAEVERLKQRIATLTKKKAKA